MVKSQTSQCYWNLNLLWNMNILCTLFPKMFPLSSSESWKKIHNFAVRVQNHPRLEHLKSKSGITYNSPLRIAHVTDWVANWLGRDVSGDIGGGCLSIFLLPPPYSLFLYLSIGWVEFIICCEGAAHDKHASGRAGAAISLGMNERPHFDPTRGGKHMFCWSWQAGYLQRGLGIPPAGGMGRWRDGKGGEGGGGLHVSVAPWH